MYRIKLFILNNFFFFSFVSASVLDAMRSSKKCCSHRVTHTYISYEQIWLIKSSSKTAAGAHTNTCNPRCVYCIVANTSTKHNLDVSSFTLGTIPSSFLWHYRIIRREKKKLDLTWFKMSPVKIWCKIATHTQSPIQHRAACAWNGEEFM